MAITDFTQAGTIGTSLRPKRYDIELFQGDSFDVSFTCKGSGGTPVNLTGVTAVAKFVGISPTVTPAQQPTVNTLGSDGVVRVTLLDTSGLDPAGEYAWD